jgi:uncharacterized membrane protein
MNRTQKIALRGMLIAVAFVLSWLEAQLPPLGMVPGIKLGLTNLVVLVAISGNGGCHGDQRDPYPVGGIYLWQSVFSMV